MGTLLIGYDVEHRQPDDVTRRFLDRATELHHRLDAPATLFLLGQTLELNVDIIRAAVHNGFFDIGQHTYSHKLFKTLYIDNGTSIRLVPGASPDEIRTEVRRTNDLLRAHLGILCIGLTAPWNYYRGLRDRPDTLQILWDEGIRYLRSDGRDANDWQPGPMTQPYWYTHTGYPDMLEMCTHGWHDCLVRGHILGWHDLQGYVDVVTPYLDRAAEEDAVFSLCAHDWSSIREDPELWHMEQIIGYARDRGLRIRTYHDYYVEQATVDAKS